MHPFHDYLCQQLDDMLKKRGVGRLLRPAARVRTVLRPRAAGDRHRLRRLAADVRERAPDVRGSPRGVVLRPPQTRFEPIADLDKPEPLIVYLPGIDRDRQTSVLMELEKSGTAYEPQLKRLALNVLRKCFTDGQIDEMLRPASVGYDDIVSFLHQGEEGKSASVLRTIFDGAPERSTHHPMAGRRGQGRDDCREGCGRRALETGGSPPWLAGAREHHGHRDA